MKGIYRRRRLVDVKTVESRYKDLNFELIAYKAITPLCVEKNSKQELFQTLKMCYTKSKMIERERYGSLSESE